MKLKSMRLLCIIVMIGLACAASADSALDQYFALRRAKQADRIQLSQVRTSPGSYVGQTFEVRGSLTGTFAIGDKTTLIIDDGDGAIDVSSDSVPQFGLGCRICALVTVGEKCSLSPTDLRLVTAVSESAVIARETRAIEVEKAKQAKVAASEQRQAAMMDRVQRAKSTVSRSGVQSADAIVGIYARAIKTYNKRLSNSQADTFARSIIGFSIKYQVDPRLVVAVILAESHFRPEATSRCGAQGLGQLMPRTAAGMGVSNAYDPVENIAASVKLIRGHLDHVSGNAAPSELTWEHLSLALASYNAGPGAVRKHGGIPPYRETRNYVKRVCSLYRQLCGVE